MFKLYFVSLNGFGNKPFLPKKTFSVLDGVLLLLLFVVR
jgi:hypothetical protein